MQRQANWHGSGIPGRTSTRSCFGSTAVRCDRTGGMRTSGLVKLLLTCFLTGLCFTSSALKTQGQSISGFVPAGYARSSTVGGSTTTRVRSSIPADAVVFSTSSYATAAATTAVGSTTYTAPTPAATRSAREEYADIRRIVQQARDELDPTTLPEPAAAKEKVRKALDELKSYIKLETPGGQGWSRFLRLPEIEEQLELERPSISRLSELTMNMRQNYVGLEYGPFLRLRNAVDEYLRAVKYGSSSDRTMRILSLRIEELLENLNEPESGAESELYADVGLVASYLVESGQAPGAVRQLQQMFRRPNVQVVARESMLNRLVGRAVAEPGPVDECILGTRILGRACLTGNVSVDLLPMMNGVSLQLQLSGHLTSKNRGYNRGVVLKTTGTSPVVASKQIIVTPRYVSSLPATVATNLTTSINRIEHRLRIVRKVASRKAAQQKPQADAIAEHRMRRRLQRQYDNQVETQLAQANAQLSELQRDPPELKRLDIPKPSFAVYSTSHSVNADVIQAADFQLAARKPCSIPRPAVADVVIELHQSAAINGLETFLAGRTIRSIDVQPLAEQFLEEVPAELLEEAEAPPWEITMAPFNPVQLAFDNDQLIVTVRISRMEGSERSIPRGAIITATYTPSYRNKVLALKRDGDLEIEVPGVRSPTQATTLRSVVRKKFDEIFREEIETDPIRLGERFPRLARFDVHRVKLDDGWLQVGIR